MPPAMPHGSVRVRVPASSANLGPGFDSIGLALGLWDEYVAEVTDEPGLVVEVSGEGAGEVPTDERHLVYRSMLAGWADLGVEAPRGLRLTATNGVPHGRGLGSSATAIVAGGAAALALAEVSDTERLNHLAARQEGHPDNSSASVHGGLTVSWTSDDEGVDAGRTRTACIPVHPDVIPVVFVPHERLATEVARKALPATVPHREAALNSGRAALLVEAMSRRPDLLLPATREWLHQEARRRGHLRRRAERARPHHLGPGRAGGRRPLLASGPARHTGVWRDRDPTLSESVHEGHRNGVTLRAAPNRVTNASPAAQICRVPPICWELRHHPCALAHVSPVPAPFPAPHRCAETPPPS